MPAEQTPPPSNLVLGPVDFLKDRDAIYDLTAKAFSSHHNYWKWHQICRGGYFEPSHYNPAASVVGKVDGVVVSHVGVWDFRMRIGSGSLRVGGIGAVATHGDYRKHGFMFHTFEQCIRQMREQGINLTLLFGIRNYYSRFGYSPAWPDRTLTAAPQSLLRHEVTTVLQPEKSILGEPFNTLHAKDNAGLTGTAIRPTYPSLLPFNEGPAYSLRTSTGELSGAFQVQREGRRLQVVEAFGDSRELLEHMARLCESEHCDDLVFRRMHPRSALAQLILSDNCREEKNHDRDGGAMARVLGLETTLQQLLPELEKRLRTYMPAGLDRPLLLVDSAEAIQLEFTDNKLKLTSTSHDPVSNNAFPDAISAPRGFSRLILGSADPLQEEAAGRVVTRGVGKILLPILFPAQEPILSTIDFF